MKTPAQRAAKRAARESRPVKGGTWRCAACGGRHPHNERCPIPRRDPYPYGFGRPGLELGLLSAIAASKGRRDV